MGNSSSNRRGRSTSAATTIESNSRVTSVPSLSPSLPALGIKEDWKEVSYVKKLISEKKLAPTPTSGSEVRDKECPICFLSYENLNSVLCCKQNVCTDCFVQLKMSNGKCACPFCGKDTFAVTYILENSPSPPKNLSDSLTQTQSPKEKSRIGTFEKTSEISIPLSSKLDRDALEDQIRNQRSSFEDEYAGGHAISRGSTLPSLQTSSSLPFQRYRSLNTSRSSSNSIFRGEGNVFSTSSDSRNAPLQRGRRSPRDALAASHSLTNSPSTDILVPGNYTPRYRRHNGHESLTFLSSGDAVSATTTNDVSRLTRADMSSASQELHVGASDDMSGRDLFVNSISDLLGTEQLSSLEQLEELMLMEAIRLSMSDVSMMPSSPFAPISSDTGTSSDIITASTLNATANAETNSNSKSSKEAEQPSIQLDDNNNNNNEHNNEIFNFLSTTAVARESPSSYIYNDDDDDDDDDDENDDMKDGVAFDNRKTRFKKSGSGTILHSRNSSGSIIPDGVPGRVTDSPVVTPSMQHIPVTTFGKMSAEESTGEYDDAVSAGVEELRKSTPSTSREHISGICTPQIWDTLEPRKEDHFSLDGNGPGSWDYSHDEDTNNNFIKMETNFGLKFENELANDDVGKADKNSRCGSGSNSVDFSSPFSSSSSSLLEKIQMALDSPSASLRSEGRSVFQREDAVCSGGGGGGGVGGGTSSRSGSIGYSVVTPEYISSGESLLFFPKDLQKAESLLEEELH